METYSTSRPMPPATPVRRTSGARAVHGLSLVEVMISLTISTFLLVAVAAAYNASADAVEMNDKFFRATQAGRVTMNQILTEIRRADNVQVFDDRVDIIRPEQSRMPNEVYRSYRYDSVARKMTLQIFFDALAPKPSSPVYSLASNVENARFGPAVEGEDANHTIVVLRVPVTIEVKIGNNQVRLSGSSGPRRAASN